eukprot:4386598-Pyramimonas_sp.AAC.1
MMMMTSIVRSIGVSIVRSIERPNVRYLARSIVRSIVISIVRSIERNRSSDIDCGIDRVRSIERDR